MDNTGGAVEIYEAMVYPGATVEEICVSILERNSGGKFNRDVFCGHTSERVNPEDKEHRLATIRKMTTKSTADISDLDNTTRPPPGSLSGSQVKAPGFAGGYLLLLITFFAKQR